MSEIFYEPFTSNLNFFTSITDPGSKFIWTADGPEGEPGILMTVDGTSPRYGLKSHTALNSGQTDARFGQYVNLHTISIPSSGLFDLFVWRTSGGTQRSKLTLFNNAGTLSIVHNLRGDDGLVSQFTVSLGGASAFRWELHISKTNGESKLYWDAGAGLVLKDTRSKTITNTFDDQTEIADGALGNPSSGITGAIKLGPLGFRDDATEIGEYPWNTAPVVDAGADQTGTLGQTKNVTTVSFTDTESNVEECNLTCEAGGTITVVANGSAIVTGNGTNAVNITGTNAEILATIDSTNGIDLDRPQVAWTDLENPPPAGHITYTDTVSVEVIDEHAASHVDSFDVVWTMETGDDTKSILLENATIAGINAEIAAALYQPEGSMEYTDALYVEVTDDNGNTAFVVIPVVVGAPTLGGSGSVLAGVGSGVLQGVL